MQIAYLLEDTPLFGGVKVVLQQASLLARRGHQVVVVSPGERPDWFPLAAEFRKTPGLDAADLPAADVTVASYWTTIPRAVAGAGEVVHYCQGFEASYTHNRSEHPAIVEAYRTPVPAMAVSPHLARFLGERFGRPARVVPQPLEPYWRARWRLRGPGRRPRILVTSPWEIDWKGVPTALGAVRELRRRGFDCALVRLSQWPLAKDERALIEPDEFHEHLKPRQVPELMRSCDLLLAASWEQEGFGLPALEAMACGVPVVASDISSFRDWTAGAARLVPFDRPEAFADAAEEVLSDARLWRRLRRRGRIVARGYHEARSAAVAEEVLTWVASGAWRREIDG